MSLHTPLLLHSSYTVLTLLLHRSTKEVVVRVEVQVQPADPGDDVSAKPTDETEMELVCIKYLLFHCIPLPLLCLTPLIYPHRLLTACFHLTSCSTPLCAVQVREVVRQKEADLFTHVEVLAATKSQQPANSSLQPPHRLGPPPGPSGGLSMAPGGRGGLSMAPGGLSMGPSVRSLSPSPGLSTTIEVGHSLDF
jgi:hypothetical protein